jgi:hypothetical protein
LNYFQARYYDSSRGQFVNEDPVFWEIGQTQDGRAALGNPQGLDLSRTTGSASDLTSAFNSNGNTQTKSNSTSIWNDYLRDPQQQNVYGYSRDNPINYFDPTGRFGFFANWSAGGNAGLGTGFAASVETGAGFTAGNSLSEPVDLGGYASYGGLAGGLYGGATVQRISGRNNNAVLGLSGGTGFGVMLTNATRISQLGGVGQSNNLTIGILSVSWSVAPDGLWTISASIGPKPILSFSTYPTATKTITALSSEQKNTSPMKAQCKSNCH